MRALGSSRRGDRQRSSERASLPDAVRGSESTNPIRFGTLNPASRALAPGREFVGARRLARHEDDARDDRLAPARVRLAVDGGLGDRGVLREDRLDLLGSDVLAAGDDRVGLSPADRQAAGRVDLAEVAGVEHRPRPGATVGPLTSTSPSAAVVTCVQNSGRPKVAICEQASVMP